MLDGSCRYDARVLRRLDVETPLGVVHLVGFAQKPDHRSVIFSILSEFCGEPVTAADLGESRENPRPHFEKLDFDVNWTHSNGYCVCAYGERGSKGLMHIGVDLERYSPRRLHLAERFFSVEEAQLVKSLMEKPCTTENALASENANDAAEREFFCLWSRKEAFYKCVGGDFFEGVLRRSMLQNPVIVPFDKKSPPALQAGSSRSGKVYLVDVDCASVGMSVPASLCVAVSPFSF